MPMQLTIRSIGEKLIYINHTMRQAMDNTDMTLTEQEHIQLYVLRATEENKALALKNGRDLALGMPTYTSTNAAAIARAEKIARELNGTSTPFLTAGRRKAISSGM